jgi:hypothetical protein
MAGLDDAHQAWQPASTPDLPDLPSPSCAFGISLLAVPRGLLLFQIYELFKKVGVVQRVIMGLDRNTKTPCGFCFVMYHRWGQQVAASLLSVAV